MCCRGSDDHRCFGPNKQKFNSKFYMLPDPDIKRAIKKVAVAPISCHENNVKLSLENITQIDATYIGMAIIYKIKKGMVSGYLTDKLQYRHNNRYDDFKLRKGVFNCVFYNETITEYE
jgi:hypothetical protein